MTWTLREKVAQMAHCVDDALVRISGNYDRYNEDQWKKILNPIQGFLSGIQLILALPFLLLQLTGFLTRIKRVVVTRSGVIGSSREY